MTNFGQHGVLNVMHKFDKSKISHTHLRDGTAIRDDNLTDENGKKWTKKELKEYCDANKYLFRTKPSKN